MNPMRSPVLLTSGLLLAGAALLRAEAEPYQNFTTAVYTRVYEVQKMADPEWLRSSFEVMSAHLHIDKVYLETHRDLVIADEATLEAAKAFFAARGVATSGGITLTRDESNRFETYCYTRAEDRERLRQIIAYTARHFDEIVLDDFYFTSCKCEECIEAKGDRSWNEYRLELLADTARDVILATAKEVNPDVRVIIKYPNWYDHFQGLGFNLEREPAIFDGLYTGTETRDAVRSAQHLQPYLGYLIFRYFEQLKPGHNYGGWVDTGGLSALPLDRYAEQLWMTVLAKAPEMTMFDFRQLKYTLEDHWRAPWAGTGTSFDFDEMIKPFATGDGQWDPATTVAPAAGYALRQIDPLLSQLGTPYGLPSYKPFHADGEAFLQNYLGMIGLPMDLRSTFPTDAPCVLLTAQAAGDPGIVAKIEASVRQGHTVVITSGLLERICDQGLDQIVHLRPNGRRALVKDFVAGGGDPIPGSSPILIPQIDYYTNDSWEEIFAVDGPNGWPILHNASYGTGKLMVLTIPDNFADLYEIPAPILNVLRRILTSSTLPVRLEGPSEVSLFVYDNGTAVVHNFTDEPVDFELVTATGISRIENLTTGEAIPARSVPAPLIWGRKRWEDANHFPASLPPHSFAGFRLVD